MPVKSLHFNWALLLSIILLLTVDQTGCTAPTFSEFGLIYFKDVFCSISARQEASIWLFTTSLRILFHSNLDNCLLKSEYMEGKL